MSSAKPWLPMLASVIATDSAVVAGGVVASVAGDGRRFSELPEDGHDDRPEVGQAEDQLTGIRRS